MQYVNDDMDELFRRAGENYPLDTSSSDWNKVLAALQGEQGETQPVAGKKGNKKRRFLWLLLLLPIGFVVSQLYSPGGRGSKEVSGKNISNDGSIVKERGIQTNNKAGNAVVVTDVNETSTGNLNPEKENSIVRKQSSELNQTSYGQNNTFPLRKTTFKKNNSFNGTRGKSFNNDLIAGNPVSGDFTGEENYLSRKYISRIDFQKAFPAIGSTAVSRTLTPSVNAPEHESKQKPQRSTNGGFYFGLMGGIDATTIKFQKIENAGFTYGALLGYQFNKRWSIESGAYVERKYYYSEGKYFDGKKIYPNMPSNFWLDDISGDCKMIELPFVVRYNFVLHKNSSWFVTAGASSYFMKKESYGYDYYYGSSTAYSHHTIDTANSSKNFFSNLNLSLGYTHRIGNIGDVRIEPYVKTPLSGMGIGNVRLFSAGLQIGLTRKF
jgi:hypothetical protein